MNAEKFLKSSECKDTNEPCMEQGAQPKFISLRMVLKQWIKEISHNLNLSGWSKFK